MRGKLRIAALLGSTVLAGQAQATTFSHVIILSVDGLHEADLTDPATQIYLPNITALAKSGISYTNVTGTKPSDSFPGTTALLTGATTRSTGVFYDDSYARNLTAPGGTVSTPRGTEVQLFENLDKNSALLSGGGSTTGSTAYNIGALDPTKLPLNCTGGSCVTVTPNQFLKTNTIFDIAHAAGLITGFSDKHPAAYTIFAGQSGDSITDNYSPEINAFTAIDPAQGGRLIDASNNPDKLTLADNTKNYKLTEAYDDLKLQATLNRIDGKTGLGTGTLLDPAISYQNFQAVSVSQKLVSNATGIGGIDLVNGKEVVNPALAHALTHTDQSIGKIVAELMAQGLDKSTLVVLTAKHGQDPRIGAATQVSSSTIPNALTAAGIAFGQITQDDVSLIWLLDPTQAAAAKAAIAELPAADGVDKVLDGSQFGSSATDNRTPDLVVQLKPGFLFDGNTASTVKRAEHGGLVFDDTAVPLILSSTGLDASVLGIAIGTAVFTTAVAPTTLAALGLDPSLLDGVRLEGTAVLPGTGIGATAVPEPMSLTLLGSGVMGLLFSRRRSAAKKSVFYADGRAGRDLAACRIGLASGDCEPVWPLSLRARPGHAVPRVTRRLQL